MTPPSGLLLDPQLAPYRSERSADRTTLDSQRSRAARSFVRIARTAAAPSWSTPQRVEGEIAILHRQIVFQLVVFKRGPAIASHVDDFDGPRRPDPFSQFEIAIVDDANQAFLVVRFHLHNGVVVLLYPQVSVGVLRRFTRGRLQFPRVFFIAEELIVELRHVALFQVFKAEVRAEEARRAVLQGDALLAPDIRTPQPLIAGAIGVIDDQQPDTLNLGGHREPQHSLAVAEGADAVKHPALGSNSAAVADHFQRAFVVLRFRALTALNLLHDLTRFLCGRERRREQEGGD